jgi:hypothetical protein
MNRRAPWLAGLSLTLTACAANETDSRRVGRRRRQETGSRRPTTLARSNPQHVPVVDPPRITGELHVHVSRQRVGRVHRPRLLGALAWDGRASALYPRPLAVRRRGRQLQLSTQQQPRELRLSLGAQRRPRDGPDDPRRRGRRRRQHPRRRRGQLAHRKRRVHRHPTRHLGRQVLERQPRQQPLLGHLRRALRWSLLHRSPRQSHPRRAQRRRSQPSHALLHLGPAAHDVPRCLLRNRRGARGLLLRRLRGDGPGVRPPTRHDARASEAPASVRNAGASIPAATRIGGLVRYRPRRSSALVRHANAGIVRAAAALGRRDERAAHGDEDGDVRCVFQECLRTRRACGSTSPPSRRPRLGSSRSTPRDR